MGVGSDCGEGRLQLGGDDEREGFKRGGVKAGGGVGGGDEGEEGAVQELAGFVTVDAVQHGE
jgi:hypothetical protein